jgi:phage N-6-adenine-methyltransferase
MSQSSRSPLQPALFSSASDEWPTPQWLYDSLAREFAFTLDPCATAANAKCRLHFFTREQDGLVQDWTGHTVFMNPPYGRVIGRWIEKAYQTSRQGSLVVALLPARTDASWWHDFVMKGEIRLLRGRLTFEGGKYPAPFPSAIVVFRPPQTSMTSVQMKEGETSSTRVRQDGLPFG